MIAPLCPVSGRGCHGRRVCMLALGHDGPCRDASGELGHVDKALRARPLCPDCGAEVRVELALARLERQCCRRTWLLTVVALLDAEP